MKKWNSLLVGWIFFCLLAGCATHRVKRDLIALLPDPDGKVGTIQVTTGGGSQILDKPGYATEGEDVNKPPLTPRPISENEIKNVFGTALSALPKAPSRFISFLLFFEHDTAELTQESKNLLPQILQTITNRESNEVYVVGHTDLVGTEAYNIELSSRRARHVRDLLVSGDIKSSSLFISYYGKAKPLVPTKDEVPEPRNRRVEVIVR
jgi:outer membrane protein OmpA-like peptidoglycan-associated protein